MCSGLSKVFDVLEKIATVRDLRSFPGYGLQKLSLPFTWWNSTGTGSNIKVRQLQLSLYYFFPRQNASEMRFPRFGNTDTGRNANLSLKDAFQFSTAAYFPEHQKALQLGNIIFLLFLCFCMTWVAQSSPLQSHCTHAGPSGSLLIIAFWWEPHVLPVSEEAAVLQHNLKFPYIEMPCQLSSKNKARFTGSADAQ